MTDKVERPTAKKKLKNLDFTSEVAHIALVSDLQGGPANGAGYALVMKTADKELIQKMQQVQVTFELPDFLRTVFNMYYEDAEVLAKVLGYVEPEKENSDNYWTDYVDNKVNSIRIMKQLHKAEKFDIELAKTTPADYLAVLQDQQMLEKAFKESSISTEVQKALLAGQAKEGLTEAVTKVKESGKSKVKPSNVKMEKSMTNEVVDAPVVPQVEMVEKSVLSSIEKALEDNKVELQKALDELNAFKEEKKQAVIKSKTKQVVDIVKDEKVNSILVKAALSLESEDDFSAFIAAINAMQDAVVNAPMFVEQGVNTQKQEVQKSAIDALIDKKYSK